jgi:hypothetical protein
MFCTLHRGPFINTPYTRGIVRFRYPILEPVRDFYVQRAKDCGIDLVVEADTYEKQFDFPTGGTALSFGGGKESRLVLGMLREFGESPRIVTAFRQNKPPDIGNVRVVEPISGAWAERLMPSMMFGAADVYFGGGLGGASYHEPWHHYYSQLSPQSHGLLSELLQSLGERTSHHSPLCPAPANLIQKMLADRFPQLFDYQNSVPANAASAKNLQVSLLKLYHGIPFKRHCSEGLFRHLLHRFVIRKLHNAHDFRPRNRREAVEREMMAIICRRRSHPLIRPLSGYIPAWWNASWIDHLHSYVNPGADPRFGEVFSEYASEYDRPSGGYQVPTPPHFTPLCPSV